MRSRIYSVYSVYEHSTWISKLGEGLTMRQCTLQITPEGLHPRIAVVFRGKRFRQDEKDAWHKSVDVYFQNNTWVDAANWRRGSTGPCHTALQAALENMKVLRQDCRGDVMVGNLKLIVVLIEVIAEHNEELNFHGLNLGRILICTWSLLQCTISC